MTTTDRLNANRAVSVPPGPQEHDRLRYLLTTVVATLALAVSVLAQAQPTDAMPAPPDLSAAAPSVRAAIEEETQRVALLIQDDSDPEQTRAGLISLGDTLFAHEFNAEADAVYTTATSIVGADGPIAYRQGLLAMFDGRTEDAIQAFGSATLATDETLQGAARVRRGRAYLAQGELESAKVDFAVALALNPASPAALAGAGQTALAAGEVQEAIDLLEEALALDPDASKLYQPLGLAYRDQGDAQKARLALEQVGEGEVQLADPVMAAIRSKSRSPQFWLQSGLAQADLGDFAAAAEQLSRAVALAPNDPVILSAYGRVLAHLGEFELAEKALEQAVQSPDAEVRDWLYLGRVQQGLGQWGEAKTAYTRAAELDPAATEPQEALGRLGIYQGEALAAAARFARLIEVETVPLERARFGYWQSLALLAAGECDLVAEPLNAAMAEVEPVDSDLLQIAARVRATCNDAVDASLEEAVQWAELAYQQRPDVFSSETLAMTFAALGRWQDAVDLQAQAIFEALKRGELDARPALQANMARYQEELPASQPLMEGDPIFLPD